MAVIAAKGLSKVILSCTIAATYYVANNQSNHTVGSAAQSEPCGSPFVNSNNKMVIKIIVL